LTYLDLHCHSVASDDSRATVEQYLKWINVLRKRGFTVDGIVLTEHRQYDFDVDYSQLAAEYGVIVLKGAELDTCFGHMLVYNITPGLANDVNFGDVKMDGRELIKAARHHGGYVVPAHPGRFGIGLVEYMAQGEAFDDVSIVELVNGGGKPEENDRAEELCQRTGYLGTGGSDAHLASHIGRVVTQFQADITTSEQLVEALISGEFRPVRIEETAAAPVS
jgi:predicted metal-dependent phosphoesterase TrpH